MHYFQSAPTDRSYLVPFSLDRSLVSHAAKLSAFINYNYTYK